MVALKDPVTDKQRSSSPGRELFRHRDFIEQPGRASHGLVFRLPPTRDPAAVAAAFEAEASGQEPLCQGFSLWTETLAEPSTSIAAHARNQKELARPVNVDFYGGRVVVLSYADGESDLIVVAHRAHADYADLYRLGQWLALGETREPAAASETTAAAERIGAQPIDWGLADPRQAGKTAYLPIPTGRLGAEQGLPRVLAATAILLARYGSAQPQLALLQALPDVRCAWQSVTATVGASPVVGEFFDLVRQARPLAHPAAGEPLPTIGLVYAEQAPDAEYQACAAPIFPLTLTWQAESDGHLHGGLWYDQGKLSSAIAAQFAEQLGRLLQTLADGDAARPIAEFVLTDAAEAARIIELGRTPALTNELATTIQQAFGRIAARHPDASAVSDDSATLNYCELDQRANRLAAGLQARGVRAGDKVGVCLDRKLDLVVTLLAILKAGAAYVPMEAKYPQERLLFTVADAGLSLVVTDSAEFPSGEGFTLLTPADVEAAADGEAAPHAGSADDLAYVIYTSGSTGKPKGVAIPHRNVATLLAATRDGMTLGPHDTWTLFHSSAFDFSVWEIWGCLLTGGHLLVVPYWVSRSPDEFYDLLVQRRVTVLNQTPSAFAALQEVDTRKQDKLALRLVIFGGEALDVRTLGSWFRRHPASVCRMVNMFGITETTVHVTQQTLTPSHIVAASKSVGRALPGWSLSVRDEAGRVQPFGVPGEIYVGGGALASHYLNHDDLTQARFIVDPVSGERVYRSGDLGRLHPDGSLDHMGRIDSQVKVRGFRIELDEIRAVLLDSPGVSAAAVLLDRGAANDAASVQIDAYLVLEGVTTVDAILQRIARYLPDYMLPSSFTALERLPVTPNGKLDAAELRRQKAAKLNEPPASQAAVPAAGDAHEQLLKVWREVLGRNVSADDDFFETGGNSLLAVRLSAAIRKLGFGAVSLRDLFMHSTPAALSSFLALARIVPGAP